MLGIKINDEFLDLMPGTQLELEQNNPYLQFGDEIVGEFSYPIELPPTEKNLRLTQYSLLIQKRADAISIDCVVYDSGFQHSRGKLRIEKPTIHLNRLSSGRISAYYLTGISSFYQDIKDIQLKAADFGGERSFSWDNFNTAGSGFWGHIHGAINSTPGYGHGYDYAFFPCINYAWHPSQLTDLVNKTVLSGGVPVFAQYIQIGTVKTIQPIIPFPYLKYVMMKAAEHVGWKLEGSFLDDADFKKIVLWNQRSVKWGYIKIGTFGVVSYHGYDPIKLNVKDFVPDITIAELFLAIRNRLGLFYEFDRMSKIIRVKKLVDVSTSGIKDFGAKVNPVIVKTVLKEKTTYALKTTEDINSIDTSSADYLGAVHNVSDLPAADETLVEKFYLVISENNFYICQQNESTTNWEWVFMTANIGGVIPANAKEEIITAALTTGSKRYDSYLDMIPLRNETGTKTGVFGEDYVFDSIVLLFNHGIQDNAGGDPYPLGSHHIYTSGGVQVGNWSLAFKGKKFDGTEVGLYDLSFKRFLDTVSAGESFEIVLNIDFVEFLQLKPNDVLSVKGVRMYIKTLKPTVPYSGSLTIEALRI